MQKSEFLKFYSGPRGSSRFLTCQNREDKDHLSGAGDQPVDPVPPLSPGPVYRRGVFNVYFSVVKFWLSSHIWLFRLVSSQLISQLIDARCRQRAWQPQRAVQPRHVTLSVRVA
ncbi:hypothetical protein EYF80_006270 [Liparis tanakae]|uniref:Uncharacterized protein n=1 Tax=Liparis tanakae TaxID=230148 RepID=A0A4Z2IZ72_9TELE|nr:hypothetical protein EYF80_006270 [Liparis tanakae]